MRLLFLGDVVGRSGRAVVAEHLPGIIADHAVDFTVINGENSAHGFGITPSTFEELVSAGADAITLGNHTWDQKQALTLADADDRFIRPANYPAGTPGRGSFLFEARNGARVLIGNVMGQLFMHPVLEDPFASADRILDGMELGGAVDAVLFDFHAETTAETMCFGHHLDGRASLVVGTHTHIPTADYQVLPGGTAYQTDAGMCGDYDSSIGMDKEEPLNRFVTKVNRGRMEVATGPATLCGVCVDVSDRTGLAERVAPLRIGGRLAPTEPDWW